ncbi:hypothetical protein Tco_0680855 [Tanacetum coccineum]|uniref:Uncharacterized protein n=1 Tax=Tanacetum coccineum TaxID=301880 RepID=A0ABQ4XMM6_9ASTR
MTSTTTTNLKLANQGSCLWGLWRVSDGRLQSLTLLMRSSEAMYADLGHFSQLSIKKNKIRVLGIAILCSGLEAKPSSLERFAAASCLCVADAVADAGVADFVRPTPVVRSDPEQGRLNFHLGIS